jgi:hypothetical protein
MSHAAKNLLGFIGLQFMPPDGWLRTSYLLSQSIQAS